VNFEKRRTFLLSLDSTHWQQLDHAYGTAEDIPALLRQLASLPNDDGEASPWFQLWSALAHQGDVYPASFAAVPHVIAALASSPMAAHASYFHFPAWVEICRAKQGASIPDELSGPYFNALGRLPALAAECSAKPWDLGFLACTLAATAAAKGQHAIAEALLEMAEEGTAEDFLEWRNDQ
jgi:hypothetical protein